MKNTVFIFFFFFFKRLKGLPPIHFRWPFFPPYFFFTGLWCLKTKNRLCGRRETWTQRGVLRPATETGCRRRENGEGEKNALQKKYLDVTEPRAGVSRLRWKINFISRTRRHADRKYAGRRGVFRNGLAGERTDGHCRVTRPRVTKRDWSRLAGVDGMTFSTNGTRVCDVAPISSII